uniref:Glycosylphosphatidylinositol anchor biosynthesis protein 11 n=1 Tax=Panagrolaimus sp. PS1159 TaxID=55785 RepID=A0AC35FB12_9BILA
MSLLKIIGYTVAAIPLFHIPLILFGAPIFDKFFETFILSTFLSILSVSPIIFTTNGQQSTIQELIFDFTPSTKSQYHTLRSSIGVIIGAWLGAFVIPLDWDRWWQEWPLPCLFFGFAGFVFGLCESFIELQITPPSKRREKYSKNEKLL